MAKKRKNREPVPAPDDGASASAKAADALNRWLKTGDPDVLDEYALLVATHSLGAVVFREKVPIPIYMDETDWGKQLFEETPKTEIHHVMDDGTTFLMPSEHGGHQATAQPSTDPAIDSELHDLANDEVRRRGFHKSAVVRALIQATEYDRIPWDLTPETGEISIEVRDHHLELRPANGGYLLRIGGRDEERHPDISMYAHSSRVHEVETLYHTAHARGKAIRKLVLGFMAETASQGPITFLDDDAPIIDHLVTDAARRTRQGELTWQSATDGYQAVHAVHHNGVIAQLTENTSGTGDAATLLLIHKGAPISITTRGSGDGESPTIPMLLAAIREMRSQRAIRRLGLQQDGSQPLREQEMADLLALIL